MSDVHLSRDELIEWRDDGAGDRVRIVTHLATCAACRDIAADVERNRPAAHVPSHFDAKDFVPSGYRAGKSAVSPRWARGWIWPAAAAALVVLAFVPVWLARSNGGPEVMRGAPALVPVRPVDVSVSVDELSFEWRGTSADDRVRLNVVDLDRADEPLIEREVTGSRYEPTPEERRRFRSGQSLHWYVEARSGAGGTSPAASFRVR
jgi:predicted anti-sigma-YlaC factor YlaD